jgi:hypothetical protein
MTFAFVYNSPFFTAVWKMADITRGVALMIIPLFLLIEFGVTFIRFFITGQSMNLLGRPLWILLLFFLLFSYKPIMGFFNTVVTIVQNTVTGDVDPYNVQANMVRINSLRAIEERNKALPSMVIPPAPKNFSEMLQDGYRFKPSTKPLDAADQLAQNAQSQLGGFEQVISGVLNLPSVLTGLIGDATLLLLRQVIWGLSAILIGFVIVIGPLAVAFECIPGIGRGILKTWFETWLSLSCWPITMSILDTMSDIWMKSAINDTSVMMITGNSTAAVDGAVANAFTPIMFIVAYIMTPKLTSLYAKGTGTTLWTGMVGALSTIKTAAVGIASGGSGMAAAGQSFMANVGGPTGSFASGLKAAANTATQHFSNNQH